MKTFFSATAALEAGTGLALVICPSATAVLLLGTPLAEPAALTVTRVCGAGLLALGVACWLARREAQSQAAEGLVTAMLACILLAVIVLASAGLGYGLHGVLLWPAVIVHAVMAGWCLKIPLRKPRLGESAV